MTHEQRIEELRAWSACEVLQAAMARDAANTRADAAEMQEARLAREVCRLTADLVAMTAERGKMRERAEAAEQDIRDMLYESTLLIDDALCLWCEHYDEPHDLCWAQDCKAECKWRGLREGKPGDTKEASHENE